VNFEQYKTVRRWKRKAGENRWLQSALENRPEQIVGFLDEDRSLEEVEAEAYLTKFLEKMEDKTFVRNLERLDNDEIPISEIRKIVTSCMTHLFIEAESNPVPDSAFSRVHTQLNRLIEGDMEPVAKQWLELYNA
jgi:hypothetical protein